MTKTLNLRLVLAIVISLLAFGLTGVVTLLVGGAGVSSVEQGIEFEVPIPTQVVVRGIDKQAVGQTAAEIRKVRPPEPYKGKGIRYEGEHVRRKVGKRA